MAVVTNSSLDIRSLQGLRSCHSGVRWTAGWSVPLGFLLSRNYLSWSKEQPLSHGSHTMTSCRAFKSLWPSKVCSPLTCFCPLEQTSARFSVPAASLEPLLWRRHSAPCAEARSLTSARRITTAKRPTASPSTAAKGPSGQPQQRHLSTDNVRVHFKRQQTLNSGHGLFFCDRCLRSGAGDVAFVDHLALDSIEGKPFPAECLHVLFLYVCFSNNDISHANNWTC